MKSYNPPNQPALTYRSGTHSTFLQRMVDRLATQTVPSDDGSTFPLTALTTSDSDDPALALLDAWSAVGDVLTFYTERIANEGFLRTAMELRSVVALANMIGYQLQPGVAASTSLAFTVEAVDASGVVTLPQGIQVQSVPGPGQVPQIFETSEELAARPEWNTLLPDTTPIQSQDNNSTEEFPTELHLTGTNTGLQPGDKLLIRPVNDPKMYAVLLQTVETSADDTYTTVTWKDDSISEFYATSNPDETQVFAFRQQAALFGSDAPRWQDMSDETQREASGVQSGLYMLMRGFYIFGKKIFENFIYWMPLRFKWPYLEFQALAAHTRDETHYLFAGTATDGVFRSTDGGHTWAACNTGLSNLMVNALFSDDRHYLFAGTTNGTLFFSTDDGDNWTELSVGNPVAIIVEKIESEENNTDTENNNGGDFGIDDNYRVLDIQVVGDGLPNTAIRALLSYEDENEDENKNRRYLLVGTDDGVYCSKNNGRTWTPFSNGLPANSTIHALSYYYNYQGTITLFAATNDDVYCCPDGSNWGRIVSAYSTSSDLRDIRALVIQGSTLFVGTRDGLFESQIDFSITYDEQYDPPKLIINWNDIWCPVDDVHDVHDLHDLHDLDDVHDDEHEHKHEHEPKDIRAMTLSKEQLLVVTPSKNSIADEWPGFEITESDPQLLDLDTVYENVLADSWALLVNNKLIRPYWIEDVSSVQGDDFTLYQKITRLTLSNGRGLDQFDGDKFRGTEVLLQSEQLPLFEEIRLITEPLKGDTIDLNGLVPALEPGRRIVVSGKRIRTEMNQDGTLVGSDGSTKSFKQGDLLIVWSPPDETNAPFILKDKTGFIGVPRAETNEQDRPANEQAEPDEEDKPDEEDETVYKPAAETDEVVSEVCFVQSMEDDDDGLRSTITLQEPLKNEYDINTVTIQANVVQATHGEIVADEVLGSGDGTRINQRFPLRDLPLTYVAAPTERGIKSTLTVRVNGIEWQEVPSFNEEDERSQCYIVRRDSTEQTYVIFGDGQKGARLPTGQENVVATYRSGIGLAGEVEANTLTMLQTSPLGVLEVSNPIAATGAANPERLANTRQNAPSTVLTMDRVVTLSDYEDFTRTFVGIGKVQGALLSTDQGKLIHLTIADTDGDPVEKGSDLYENLLTALNQRRNRLQPLQMDSYEPLFFTLTANIFYDTRHKEDAVEKAIRSVLLDSFSFQKRAFAQDVTASEVIAVIQAVEGVIAVDLEELSLTDPASEGQPPPEGEPDSEGAAPEGQPPITDPAAPEGKPAFTDPAAPEGKPAFTDPAAPEGKPAFTDPAAPEGKPAFTDPAAPEGEPDSEGAAPEPNEDDPEQPRQLLPADPARWSKGYDESEVHPAQLLLIDSTKEESISLTLRHTESIF